MYWSRLSNISALKYESKAKVLQAIQLKVDSRYADGENLLEQSYS